MLLAVTNHVCLEMAVIPMLWVVPLSLYLLSFAICFDREQWYFRRLFAFAFIAVTVLFALALDGRSWEILRLFNLEGGSSAVIKFEEVALPAGAGCPLQFDDINLIAWDGAGCNMVPVDDECLIEPSDDVPVFGGCGAAHPPPPPAPVNLILAGIDGFWRATTVSAGQSDRTGEQPQDF